MAETALDRLESWKEIASYLGRDVKTAQRWEKREGLPVHRHQHEKQSSVYAFKSELDLWRKERQPAAERADATDPEVLDETTEETLINPRPPAAPPFPWKRWLMAAAGLIVVGGAIALWLRPGHDSNAAPPSIAVLPFENLSGDSDQEWLSDGMTEELTTQLGHLKLDRLSVIARGSAMAYKGSRKGPHDIARELSVEYLVIGGVRLEQQHVRISVHLLRSSDLTHILDDSYDRELQDVLSVEQEVAGKIAAAIEQTLQPSSGQPQSLPASAALRASTQADPAAQTDPAAIEAYLRGRQHWNRRTPGDLFKALVLFQSAIRKDGKMARAYVGIADCYALLGSVDFGILPPRFAMPKAKEAVLQALRLQPELAEAHASLGYINLMYDWDWPSAQREFASAISHDPNYPVAHQWSALYFNLVGDTQRALAELNEARRLDPLSPAIRSATAETFYFARRFADAERSSREALDLDPKSAVAYLNLGRALLQQGKNQDAIAAFRRGREFSGRGPGTTTFLAHALALSGKMDEAFQLQTYLKNYPGDAQGMVPRDPAAGAYDIHGKPYVPALYAAGIDVGLNRIDDAFRDLEKAFDERCNYVIFLGREPMADPLRSDGRYRELVRKMSLP